MKEFFLNLWKRIKNRLNRRKVKLRKLTSRQKSHLDFVAAQHPTVKEYLRNYPTVPNRDKQ